MLKKKLLCEKKRTKRKYIVRHKTTLCATRKQGHGAARKKKKQSNLTSRCRANGPVILGTLTLRCTNNRSHSHRSFFLFFFYLAFFFFLYAFTQRNRPDVSFFIESIQRGISQNKNKSYRLCHILSSALRNKNKWTKRTQRKEKHKAWRAVVMRESLSSRQCAHRISRESEFMSRRGRSVMRSGK